MRKKLIEYRMWKKEQNEKKLKRRTEKKQKKHGRNERKALNKKKQIDKVFTAPEVFSIIKNPSGTISFLNEIINVVQHIKKMRKQYSKERIWTYRIDMKNIKLISSDALMYLLTIMQNTRGKRMLPINWIGNFPEDQEVKEYLKRSGFLRYMKTSSENIVQVDDNIQIKYGEGFNYIQNNIENDIRKEIIDFSCIKLKKDKREINYLMTILTEMITNIIDHAYQKKDMFRHEWYIFVENKEDKITYIFMDNGLGIPNTIRKNIFEKIVETFNAENEYKYIETALSGIQKRSETGKRERGNGLPSIYEQYLNKKIENFVIISNKAYYSEKEKYDLSEELNGTVFYWEIKKEEK